MSNCQPDYPSYDDHDTSTETEMLTCRASRDRCDVQETTGLVLPSGFYGGGWGGEYTSDVAFFPKDDKNKPHLACIISDTTDSADMMLRSEIHGAFYLVTYQMVIKLFTGHRVKPVSCP